jgi:glycosyltransferase involved in cell wall biosynthesis
MFKTPIKVASILCVGKEWFLSKPGGLDRYVYELINQLTLAGDRVELCAVSLPDLCPQPSLSLTNLASTQQSVLQRLWTSQRQFQQRSLKTPDSINLHFALYSFPLLTTLPKNVPITFTFHGPWALESEWEGASNLNVWVKKWIEQKVYQRCDRFIVLSKAFGTILHDHYNVPWSKIHVIPGGVDTARFQMDLSREQARQQLGWPCDRFILFAPRRLVQRMGLDVLLNALATVKAEHPEIWLSIAGKGPQREALEHQVSELGLGNHVKFLGYVPDEQLPIAYQAADLTTIPSQSLEGFGLVLLESLACGTPVLCTPVGGMPEVLTDFSPELITDSAEATAISDRLKSLLQGDLTLPTRESCREYAVKRFDWQIIAPQVRQVLLKQEK